MEIEEAQEELAELEKRLKDAVYYARKRISPHLNRAIQMLDRLTEYIPQT